MPRRSAADALKTREAAQDELWKEVLRREAAVAIDAVDLDGARTAEQVSFELRALR